MKCSMKFAVNFGKNRVKTVRGVRKVMSRLGLAVSMFAVLWVAACGANEKTNASAPAASNATSSSAAPGAMQAGQQVSASDAKPTDAVPADKTGGFDGAKAYEYTAKQVEFGPRPPNSDAIHKTQDYIIAQLKSDGCAVDTDDFHSQTPIGDVPMKNIIAKIPGETNGILLLMTHYDTLRKDNFVGANDAGSSTGVMMEMARLLCGKQKKEPLGVWIAFLDGEEAFVQWSDTDSVYGSRQLAARMAMAGDLPHIKAVILADIVGSKSVKFRKDGNSTPWLTTLVWSNAAKLGYGDIFLSDTQSYEDDHLPFVHRKVPSVDILDLVDFQKGGYWHTDKDTMNNVSAKSLGIVGHVIVVTVDDLQKKPNMGK